MASSFTPKLPATGYRLTTANESFAPTKHLTYFQSVSPFASVNESIASANDVLPLVAHLPCFQGEKGVTKVTPLPSSVESVTTPHNPPPPGDRSDYPCTETPANDSTATPRTGCPNHSAGSNLLESKSVSSSARVPSSLGPETMS